MRWLLLTPIVQSMTVFELWDDDAFHALATRAVRLARETGALAMLPVALVYRSGVHVFAGELAAASALIEEADDDRGRDRHRAASCTRGSSLGAWRGVEAEAMELIDAGLESATREGRVPALAGYATAVLNNGLGRYEAAARRRQARQRRRRLGLRRRVAAGARRGGVPLRPAGGRRRRAARGWRSARAPRARTGRSASWPARGRC